MIKSIEIYKPKDISFFKTGDTLFQGEEKTKIKVIKITEFFGTAKVYLSNKEVIIFKGFPLGIVKE